MQGNHTSREVSGGSRQSNDPLHGVTLEQIVTRLVERYGWETLGRRIDIRCFTNDPSVKSSLTFLRKTPWACAKVESLYKRMPAEGSMKRPDARPARYS